MKFLVPVTICVFSLSVFTFANNSLAAPAVMAASAKSGLINLRCEYLSNPLSIDAATPRLSWVSAIERARLEAERLSRASRFKRAKFA